MLSRRALLNWSALSAVCAGLVACGGQQTYVTITGTGENGNGTIAAGGATTGYSLAAGSGDFVVVPFLLSASGNESTEAQLLLPNTFGPTAIAVDPNNGTIYVGGANYLTSAGVPEVLVYSAGSTGTAAPMRTIVGDATAATFDEPISMTVDKSGNLYVASTPATIGTMTQYGSAANGTATPTRVLTGAATGMYQPTQVAVDGSDNVYVSNDFQGYAGNVVEFSTSQSGNVPPARVVTDDTHVMNGVGVDSQGTMYVLEGTLDQTTGFVTGSRIAEYTSSQTGAATPHAVLSGSSTGLANGGSVEIDGKDNLYVSQATALTGSAQSQLLIFGPQVSGSTAPAITITGSTTTKLFLPFAVK